MDWLNILKTELENGKSIAQVGREIGYSRTAVSLAIKGNYPGGTKKIATATLAKYTNRLMCPHMGTAITFIECRAFAAKSMPTSSPRELKHWSACKRCTKKTANDATQPL